MRIASGMCLALGLAGTFSSAAEPSRFEYTSPRPGARFVAAGTTILLKFAAPPASFPSIVVRGSASGEHEGEWSSAEVGATLIFRPDRPFADGETVAVTVGGSRPGEAAFAFSFEVSEGRLPGNWRAPDPCGAPGCAEGGNAPATRSGGAPSLPDSFPPITITIDDDPAPGQVFVSPRRPDDAGPDYAVMAGHTGAPAFFRRLPDPATDFKQHPHVNLYSYVQATEGFVVVDETFERIDVFAPENGYGAIDAHDFQILPNGNVWVGIQDIQVVDMSEIVEGGNPAALVKGFVMQEQDPSHNVVFQWRSWDHFEITDASHVNFTGPVIDYVHWNSFELDADGDILISSRSLCEVTKIDRDTGDVLWRMGGSQNEFALVGDTQWYSRQHDARRTSTGTVTVFDNGTFNTPQESRALEYSLDEVGKVATLVWEFRNDPPRFGFSVGNAQRLANGNTLISWAKLGIVSEVRSDGTKAFEMVMDDHWTYRAFRFPWDGVAARPELWYTAVPYEVTLHFEKFGDPDVPGFNVYRGAEPEPTNLVGWTSGGTFPLAVALEETLYVRVTEADSSGANESAYSNELFIVAPGPVGAPVSGGVSTRALLRQNRPNPFAPSTTIGFVMPGRGTADLSVYDVRGRFVRRLAEDVFLEGSHEVVWDGTDSRGVRVGSGVYFYVLETKSERHGRRMLLLR